MRRACVTPIASGILAMLAVLAAPAGAAWAACPNQALRAELDSEQLPECRAYELVTPALKYGWTTYPVSADSSHVVVYSIGAFQGSNQASLENFYDIERTPEGWITSPFVEPGGLSGVLPESLADGSADLSGGLFEYRLSSPSLSPNEANLYISPLPAGTPVEVGPMFSREALVDNPQNETALETSTPSVSNNFTTVVFAIAGPNGLNSKLDYRWPGDTTVRNTGPLDGDQGFNSLYEYRGTGSSSPTLVGVSDGRTLIDGRLVPAGELISQCGDALGFPVGGSFHSESAETISNAISADGSRIFFTAAGATQGPLHDSCTGKGAGVGPPADELFARTDESETTAISEPSPEDCAACNTSSPAEAVFQGASEDGSKAFFLSEQQLLPGARGESLYEYDFDAAKEGRGLVLVAPEAMGVARIAESGSWVYFVSAAALTPQANEFGASAKEGEPNLYAYDTEDAQMAFIGTLAVSDSQDWNREDTRPVDATPDGRFLLFESRAHLTPDDTASSVQVFEYDAQQRTLVRVSLGQNGFDENGNANEYGASIVGAGYRVNPAGESEGYTGRQDPAPQLSSLSADGSVAVFESRGALTPQAIVGYPNVYEYHAGQVSLISDGQDRTLGPGGHPSVKLLGIEPSGTDLFFTTADQLVPQDGDTQVDIYDARVDGGFAPSPPPACEGEGCQGPLALAPVFGQVASAIEAPGENSVQAPVSKRAGAKVKTKVSANRKRKRRHKSATAPKSGHRSAKRGNASREIGHARMTVGSSLGGRSR
jgi:hypothetical protein